MLALGLPINKAISVGWTMGVPISPSSVSETLALLHMEAVPINAEKALNSMYFSVTCLVLLRGLSSPKPIISRYRPNPTLCPHHATGKSKTSSRMVRSVRWWDRAAAHDGAVVSWCNWSSHRSSDGAMELSRSVILGWCDWRFPLSPPCPTIHFVFLPPLPHRRSFDTIPIIQCSTL